MVLRQQTRKLATILRIVFGLFVLWMTSLMLQKGNEFLFQPIINQEDQCLVSHGKYNGHIYTSNDRGGGTTVANRCLVQSKWMRLAQHSVQLPGKDQVIDDWLWIDYHDRINVLVEAPKSNREEDTAFLIIEQTKYALDSIMSLAIVGGIIEPITQIDDTNGRNTQVILPEAPLKAAEREVEEEMGVTCQTWIPLGKFRTDVNRGMGWVHPFLAKDCKYSFNLASMQGNANLVVGGADTEQQKLVTMTFHDVREAVKKGRFLEVQWSNTVALAMLRYE